MAHVFSENAGTKCGQKYLIPQPYKISKTSYLTPSAAAFRQPRHLRSASADMLASCRYTVMPSQALTNRTLLLFQPLQPEQECPPAKFCPHLHWDVIGIIAEPD